MAKIDSFLKPIFEKWEICCLDDCGIWIYRNIKSNLAGEVRDGFLD